MSVIIGMLIESLDQIQLGPSVGLSDGLTIGPSVGLSVGRRPLATSRSRDHQKQLEQRSHATLFLAFPFSFVKCPLVSSSARHSSVLSTNLSFVHIFFSVFLFLPDE